MPRGLEILIPQKQRKDEPPRKESVFWIEIKKIKANPLQPRKEFNQKELKELARSIEKYGILQPLLAKKIVKSVPQGEKVDYQIIAGERRLRAAKMLGMKEVPVIVQEVKTEDELPISLVENIQRENLNAIEKALSYKELLEKHGLTQKEIGDIIGKSRETVANTLRLLELPKEIKDSISKKEISEGHARALLSVPGDKRINVFKKIIKEKIPVREVERKGKKRVTIEKTKSSSLLKLEKDLLKKIGIPNIKIIKNNGKIKLKLVFESEKELNEFIKKIK